MTPTTLMMATAALTLSVMMAGRSASAQTTTLPAFTVPDACAVQLKNHNYDRKHLEYVRDLGFRVVRKGIYWNAVEKEKGVYDFTSYDRLLADADELGLRVIGCLFGGNKLYEDDGRGGVKTEAGRAGFAAFAAAAAARYQGRGVLWEIWNEPNVRTFWRKDGMHNSDEFAGEYTDLVRAAVPAMLEADPGCFVMAGSVSNYWKPSYEWTEFCLKRGILESGIRGWSVHPYGVKTPEEFAVGHQITRDLLTKYGAAPDFPIVNTERGFAVKERDEGWSGGSKERALEFQAWQFVRQYMIDMMFGVRLTTWYELDGDEFGITHGDAARPIEAACRTMFKQLDGYRYVQRLDAENSLDYVLVFENAAGDRKLVAWTAPPAGGAPDEGRDHFVAIELGQGKTLSVVQHDGVATDTASGLPLLLTGAPQYVAMPKGAELGRVVALASPVLAAPAKSATPMAAPQPIAGAVDLKLFDGSAEWKFIENTGKGSFTLAKDGDKPIGVLNYDFTASKAQSTPYVMATGTVSIAEGPVAIVLHVRSNVKQRLTFRIVDQTGQTHQFKSGITGSGGWEAIRIPLNRKLEHWDGAKDGKIHYPIKQIAFSVPLPSEEHKTGKVEYADAVVVGE